MEAPRESIRNLFNHCAEVHEGDRVLILNEYGKVESEITDLIAEAVKATGAEYHVLWGETIDRAREDLPPVLINAMLAADKTIVNFGLNRAVVDRYTRGRGMIQINNTCRTAQMMTHPHATFHWGMVKAIFGRLEELFADAETWHITSPAGTDISGQIGKESDIADAYFAAEAAASRFIRVFPGEVFTPVGAVGAQGRIALEYINMRDSKPWGRPAVLTVQDNRVCNIEGGEEARRFEQDLDRMVQQFGDQATTIDSWHGGMNPRARVPTGESLVGATSGPGMMHFHVGRTTDPFSAGVLNHTIEVDGRKLYENGQLLVMNDSKIQEAARRLGVGDV